MKKHAILHKEGLAFYRDLAERVSQDNKPLQWAKKMVRKKRYQGYILPKTLLSLAGEARRARWQSPRRGYNLAAIAYTAARLKEDELLQAHCALALAKAGNRLGLWPEAIDLAGTARPILARRGELLAAAWSQLGLATASHHLNRNPEAIHHCLEAQNSFRQQNQPKGTGRAALLLAAIYRTQGQYLKARRCARQARQELAPLGPGPEVGRVDLELAYISACQQRFEEAQLLLDRTRHLFHQAGLMAEVAQSHLIEGWIHLDRGDYHQALEIFSLAHQIYRTEGMPAALRQSELNMANAYRRLGCGHKALPIYFRLRRDFARQNMTINQAQCAMNIGLTLKQQGQYRAALNFFQQAEQTCLQAGLRLHAARCQTNMAQVEELLGAYDRAFERHQQAREAFRQAGLEINVGHCEENMARICLTMGHHKRALALLQSARQAFEQAGALQLLVDNQLYLAQFYQLLGQDESAEEILKQACRAYGAEQMPGQQALCLLHLAGLKQNRGDLTEAVSLYRQAHREFVKRRWPVNRALAELGLGEISLEQGQTEAAFRWFSSALPVFDPHLPDWAWRTHFGLARYWSQQQKEPQALDHYLAAIEAIRRGRAGLSTPQGSNTFFAGRQHVYDQTLALALRLGQPERAVEIMEQARAQAYLALLHHPVTGLRPSSSRGPLADLLARERALQRQIELLQNSLCFPSTAGTDQTASNDHHLMDQLAKAQQRHQELVARLFRARSLWAAAIHPPPFELNAFRQTINAAWPGQWAALAYYLSGSQLTILYLDRDSASAWTRTLTSFEKKLLHICTSPDQTRRRGVYEGVVGPYPTFSSKNGGAFLRHLYPILIPAQVKKRLSPRQLLVIAPHGILHALPFHTLQAPEGPFLVEQATLVYAPSLHILQLLLKRKTVRPSTNQAKKKALVIGVSHFGPQAPPLPAVQTEARTVHRLLGNGSRLWLNEEATRATLLAMSEQGHLQDYHLIHFATHTLFEEAASLQSRLLLHDGPLTVAELFDLSLDADLVTLSSCEGARGEVNVGDEIMGLAQAFFHAGARALLAGLWKVPDETTEILMTAFYRALQAGQAPAQALRSAQLQLKAAGYPPFHWAPFILLGHPGRAWAEGTKPGEQQTPAPSPLA